MINYSDILKILSSFHLFFSPLFHSLGNYTFQGKSITCWFFFLPATDSMVTFLLQICILASILLCPRWNENISTLKYFHDSFSQVQMTHPGAIGFQLWFQQFHRESRLCLLFSRNFLGPPTGILVWNLPFQPSSAAGQIRWPGWSHLALKPLDLGLVASGISP